MQLTTQTARELENINELLKRIEEIPHSSLTISDINWRDALIEKKAEIISIKNELKEILEDKNPDEPILKYYERMYIKLMTLKEEIESVEKVDEN